MAVTVNKTIGTNARDHSTLQAWEDNLPSDLTTTRSSNIVAGATTSAIILDVGASGTDDFYTGHPLTISGESRLITAYVGVTKVATVGALNGSSATYSTAPTVGTVYVVEAAICVGQCYNDAEFSSSSTILTITGETTDATSTITLTTAAGQSFRDNASASTNPLIYDQSKGVGITSSSASRAISVTVPFVILSNLQIKNTGNSPGVNAGSTNNVTIDNCIVQGGSDSGGTVVLASSTSKIRNSLVLITVNNAYSIVDLFTSAKAYNCTFAGSSALSTKPSVAISCSTSSPTLENVALFNASAYKDSTTPTYTTCYSDIATPPTGVTQVTYDNTQFINTTADWRIPSTSSMKDTGTTDTTNAATDIIGTARPQGSAYDVGCWEYKAVVAPSGVADNAFGGRRFGQNNDAFNNGRFGRVRFG